MYLGLPARYVCLASISRPESSQPASEYRKYLAEGNLLFVRCDNKRDFIPISPSLLPRYIRVLFLFAISYIPHIPLGILSMLSRLNSVHLFMIGILSSLNSWYCTMCYNIVTSFTSPLAVGRLELPRHKATESQARPVCQFQHTANENTGGGRDSPQPPSPDSHLKHTPKHGHLSISKTIDSVANIDDKPIIQEAQMAVCPKCYSREMIKFGKYGRKQKWHCLRCGYTTTRPRQRRPKGYA